MSDDSTPRRKPYSVEEAAALLGICRNTAYARVKDGSLPSITLGRRKVIPAPALDRMLDGQA